MLTLGTRASRVIGRGWAGVRRRTLRPPRRTDVAVRVNGPGWLAELLEPTFQVVTSDRDRISAPVIEASEAELAPFAQVMLSNPVRRRWPAGLPDEYAERARRASCISTGVGPVVSTGVGLLERPGDEDAFADWLELTRHSHRAYRDAHARTADEVIDDRMRLAGLIVSRPHQQVTAVCVTMRPERFEAVLASFDRQVHSAKQLLVITNSDQFDLADVRRRVDGRSDVRVVEAPASMSLGACLNLGIEATTTRYLAKFDDDDEYGSFFLHDLLLAHRYAGAGVVGKHCYHAYLAERDLSLLRFPGREFTYTPYLAGGTLVIDLERTGSIRFPDLSIGEDQGFIAACHRHGIATFGADRFNFVQVRHGRNTWNPPIEQYLGTCAEVGPGMPTDLVHV